MVLDRIFGMKRHSQLQVFLIPCAMVCFAACGNDDPGGEDGGDAAIEDVAVISNDAADASSLTPVECTADAAEGDESNTPDEQKSHSGENGVYVDECNSDGDLTLYACETDYVCDSNFPNPGCTFVQTGNVAPVTMDCDGQCVSGTCDSRCPAYDDVLTYLSVAANGDATFENSADGRKYTCELSFDQSNDTYDCVDDPVVGDTIEVWSIGLIGTYCTGGAWGGFGITECSYGCTFLYD
jgi:hypothetical protein